jgi:hypothetical protein
MSKPKTTKTKTSAKKATTRTTRPRRGPLTPETPLTPKERRFVLEYVGDGNGAAAARAAGYAPGSAKVTASRLLTKANVQALVAIEREKLEAATRLDKANAIRKLESLFFEPIPVLTDYYVGGDLNGPLRSDLTRAEACRVQSVKVVKRNLTAGDKRTDWVLEVKLFNLRQVQAGLAELVFKHLNLLEKAVDERPPVPAFALPADTPGVSVH